MINCCAGIQSGKGLWEEEPVLTDTGYRPIKDISIGDVLFDRDGKPTKVTAIFVRGKQPCYKISYKTGHSLIVDQDHLHVIRDPHGRSESVLSTHQLLTSRRCFWDKTGNKAQVPACGPINLSKKRFYIHPYILGCLLGDGGLRTSVTITIAEVQIANRIAELLPTNIEIRKGKEKYAWSINERQRVTNIKGYGYNSITRELRRLDLMGKYSYEKHIPNEYLYGSIDQRLELLRGLMDTDGYVKRKKEVIYYSTSKELADGVRFLVESLGGKTWIRTKIPKFIHKGIKKTGRLCYCVHIILSRYNPFYLPRKFDQNFLHKHTENKVLDRIEYVGERPSICIQVDSPTKTFIAKDQIVTHNSEIGVLWLRTMISIDKDMSSNYLLTSPTYRLLNQSLLPKFFKYFSGLGTYRAGDSKYTLHDGRVIYIRSLNNSNAIEGIPQVRYCVNDEAGMISNRSAQNIITRLATAGGRLMNTSTPYLLGNWFHQSYLEWQRGQRPDEEWIVWRTIDNPYINHEEVERLKLSLPPAVYRLKYEASFEQPAGLVYTLTEQNFCDPFKYNSLNYDIVAGLDFGYSISATALVVIARDRRTDVYYIIYEFKRTHLDVGGLVETLRQIHQVYKFKSVYCDSANPMLIDELSQADIPATAIDKGPDSVVSGILNVQTLIQAGKLKVFNNLDQWIDEARGYSWDEKILDKPKPIKVLDDLMDATRYGILGMGYHYEVPRYEIPKTRLQRVISGDYESKKPLYDDGLD